MTSLTSVFDENTQSLLGDLYKIEQQQQDEEEQEELARPHLGLEPFPAPVQRLVLLTSSLEGHLLANELGGRHATAEAAVGTARCPRVAQPVKRRPAAHARTADAHRELAARRGRP